MNAAMNMVELSYCDAINNLLQPISSEAPAGDDLSFSTLFDEVREARRADDADLQQGAWEINIKNADWHRVRSLCESALSSQTKDLQLAAWYIEALVHLEGFAGFANGLELFHGLVTNYWACAYPLVEYGDLDERAGKVSWLNTQLPLAIKRIPITDHKNFSYSWLQWQESRWVENLGQRDPAAKALAINEGKLAGETFDKAAQQSERAFGETLVRDVERATLLLKAVIDSVENAFGADAPSLIELRQALLDCKLLVDRLYGGVHSQLAPAQATDSINAVASSIQESLHPSIPRGVKIVGALSSREDAVQALRDVAHYFRINEPHSPVALLAARAAKWAEMSVEEWLSTVIKDDATLTQLRELLDISAPH